MRKIRAVLGLLLACACVTPTKRSTEKIFLTVSFKDTSESILQKFGPPSEKSFEVFQKEYPEVYLYYGDKANPTVSFTLSSEGKVIGKTIWCANSFCGKGLSTVVKDHFSDYQFKKLIPCSTNTEEVLLADQRNGVFIYVKRENPSYVSWANPMLAKLRIEQIFTKCPAVQLEKERSFYY